MPRGKKVVPPAPAPPELKAMIKEVREDIVAAMEGEDKADWFKNVPDAAASAPPLPPHAMDDRIAQLEAELLVAKHDLKVMKQDRDEYRDQVRRVQTDAEARTKHLEEKVAYQRQSIREYEAKLRANGLL